MLMLQENFSLSWCSIKLIILAKYGLRVEMENGKSYIQPCSLFMNGTENLAKDSKIGPFFFYDHMLNYTDRYYAFLFLHFFPCEFCQPGGLQHKVSLPYSTGSSSENLHHA